MQTNYYLINKHIRYIYIIGHVYNCYTRHSVIICIPMRTTTYYRLMLNTTKRMGEVILQNAELQQVSHTALALCRTLSTPSVVKALSTNNIKDASQEIHNYINHTQGTIQLRTILLSVIGEHAFDLEKMLSHYNNSKLLSVMKNISIPVRSLAELHIVERFLNRFDPYIDTLRFTGDTMKFETKKNPFQDIISDFAKTPYSFNSSRSFDVKSGNFCKGEFFKGEIRQITFADEQTIWYPSKSINLREHHYRGLAARLKSDTFLSEAQKVMDKTQYEYLRSIVSQPYSQVMDNSSYNDIEETLMKIQTLSTFPKAFNFVNVHYISKQALTKNELSFIEEMAQFVNPHILNNPRNMQQFMLKALKVYRSHNDNNVFHTMKPLKNTQGWLSSELDKLGVDIFT